MTRPATCPVAGGEPCQCMCMDECSMDGRRLAQPKEHDPHHPLVRSLKGCGHGVLFTDYCKDCEIVSVMERYKTAIRTVQHCRNDLRRLGVAVPGMTTLPARTQEGASHE